MKRRTLLTAGGSALGGLALVAAHPITGGGADSTATPIPIRTPTSTGTSTATTTSTGTQTNTATTTATDEPVGPQPAEDTPTQPGTDTPTASPPPDDDGGVTQGELLAALADTPFGTIRAEPFDSRSDPLGEIRFELDGETNARIVVYQHRQHYFESAMVEGDVAQHVLEAEAHAASADHVEAEANQIKRMSEDEREVALASKSEGVVCAKQLTPARYQLHVVRGGTRAQAIGGGLVLQMVIRGVVFATCVAMSAPDQSFEEAKMKWLQVIVICLKIATIG